MISLQSPPFPLIATAGQSGRCPTPNMHGSSRTLLRFPWHRDKANRRLSTHAAQHAGDNAGHAGQAEAGQSGE